MARNSEDLIAGLVADLQPVRPLRLGTGMTYAVLALLGGVLGVATLHGLRSDIMAGRPDDMLLMGSGLFLVLALASAWAVVDLARPYVGLRREGWGWTALMAGVLPAAATVLIAFQWLRGEPLALGRASVDMFCTQQGLGWGLLTAAALVLWLRRGAPSLPQRAGLLTGVAAGAAGIFAASLYCPHNDLIHIGLWHGMTVVLTGVLGRIVVPRLIAW